MGEERRGLERTRIVWKIAFHHHDQMQRRTQGLQRIAHEFGKLMHRFGINA